MNHTPLPIALHDEDDCLISQGDGQYFAETNSEEKAALIVTAVNNHQKLVDELRNCVQWIVEARHQGCPLRADMTLASARALLAELEAK